MKRVAPMQASLPQKVQKMADAQQDTTIIVFSTAERDEIGIRTLVGEYKDEGTNHGRRFFKKTQKIPGHEDIDVYLYFWDERDGPSFSGWWFGNQVGGAQVWSRNRQCTLQPPKSGWTIPWDGEVKKELMVMNANEKSMLDRKEAEMRQVMRRKEEEENAGQFLAAEWEERVQKATEKAANAEIDATQALEMSKLALEGDLDDESIMQSLEGLGIQAVALSETQRIIAVEGLAAQKAPPALKAEMMALGQRVRKLQAMIKEDQEKLKGAKLMKVKQMEVDERRAEEEVRERELEGQHTKQLEEMMPAAMEKVDMAEDEVEKVAIAAAPLGIETADDLRPVMLQAIKETEQRVRAAQAAIGEARRFISGKISQAQKFVPSTKKAAADEFASLQAKLTEAQEKLNPFKTVRQDYEQRVQGKKLFEDLSGKLAGAEIEVEKASMMTAPLGGDSFEGIKETEGALSAAQSALSQSVRLIESKLKSVERTKGPFFDDVKLLQERAKQAQEKLDDVRKTVKETQIRIAADTLLREVAEKVSIAEDELQRMAEAELPFLRGEMKGNDLNVLIADADKVAVKVHSALAEAQTFVAKKLIEVARFTEGPAKAVREEIDMLQKRLEEGRERLQQFRSSTAERKRSHLLQEVESKVSAAEIEVQKMTEATVALSAIGPAGEVLSEGLKETVEQANLSERAAQASVVVARKFLLQMTAELKKLAVSGSGSGTELGKLQTRVNNMQQEIAKLRNATKDAEDRIRVKQMLSEVAMRLQAAEVEVDKVASAAVPISDDQPSVETVERMEKATISAQNKISTTSKLVDIKLKTAQGFLKEELQGMKVRISQAERKLADVIRSAKEQKERLQAAELISLAVEKVEKAEAEVQRTAEAELPFLKGIEVLVAKDALNAVVECEAAATATQKAITEARTFIVQKLVDAKQFSGGPSESCTKELLALQKKLDQSAQKLTELKKDTADRKRKTQMQASAEKITGVETAVQKLGEAMTKFADDKLGQISEEEARTFCEEIAIAEQDATTAVSSARKFLAQRVQEAKTFSEVQRGPMTADLAKLQSRLTQCQVELAKLSKQCTEREQRFVAQKLLQDATRSFESLQADVAYASKVATPLVIEGDNAELLKVLHVQAFGDAVQALMKKSGTTAENVFAQITKGKTAKSEEFVVFVDGLPELAGKEDASFTEEQSKAIFSSIAGKGGKLAVENLQAALRERWVCIAAAPASEAPGGKEASRVEVGESVEVELQKDDEEGATHAKCILERDGTTAWVPLTVGDAPNFKAVSSGGNGRVESIDAHVTAVHDRCVEAAELADRKMIEVASVKLGPLAEVKSKLLAIRSKLSQEQSKIEQLKKRASIAKSGLLQQRKDELNKVQEVRCKAFATKSVTEATAAVVGAEESAGKVTESAKSGSAEKLQNELSVKELDEIKRAADGALQSLAEARATVSRAMEAHEAYKAPSRNFLLQSRVELTKLAERVNKAEKKCRTSTDAVRTAYVQVVKKVTEQAREALRTAARKVGKDADQLFDQVSGKKAEITEAQFTKFVEGLAGHGLTKEQISLVFREFGPHGLRKPGFAKALQEFCRCARTTTIHEAIDISSNTIRKLELGELFEVLEGPSEEKETKIMRVRGRALRDGAAGWVTVKGNQGTPFLKAAEKPYLWVAGGDATLHEKFSDTSSAVRKLHTDEVMELLEGPREEVAESEILLRGIASKDTAAGWITLRDMAGTIFAAPSKKIFVCRSTIAMTDVFDIRDCKVVRKVDVGEALEVTKEVGEREDANVSIKRLQFKALRDGKEGWVTLRGNQGTIYVEASKSHYIVEKEISMREGPARDAAVLKDLKAGDAFEALEPPKEERPESRLGFMARALEDGKAGWVLFSSSNPPPVRPWAPKYVVKAAVPLTAAMDAKDADTLRLAAVGEVFEAIEGPIMDKSTGQRRIRCATSADGAVGWATLRKDTGAAFLEASLPDAA